MLDLGCVVKLYKNSSATAGKADRFVTTAAIFYKHRLSLRWEGKVTCSVGGLGPSNHTTNQLDLLRHLAKINNIIDTHAHTVTHRISQTVTMVG